MRRYLLPLALLLIAATPSYNGLTLTGYIRVPMRVVTASGAITVSATTDYFICVNKTTGAATAVNLPASPATGQTYLIKDCKGDAATNAITVTPAAGNVDGAATYVINTNRASVAVTYTGAEWSRKLVAAVIALALLAGGALAAWPGSGQKYPAVAGPAPYVGPGDLVAGWSEWHGLRAYSAAVAATGTHERRPADPRQRQHHARYQSAHDGRA